MDKRRGKKEETRVRQGPENRRDEREKGARAARKDRKGNTKGKSEPRTRAQARALRR